LVSATIVWGKFGFYGKKGKSSSETVGLRSDFPFEPSTSFVKYTAPSLVSQAGLFSLHKSPSVHKRREVGSSAMEGMRTKGILKSTDSRTWDFGEGVKYQVVF
jgi:hypothetical protein